MLYRNSYEDMGTGIAPVCNLEEWIKKQLTITNTITVTNNSGKNVWIYISPKKIHQLKKLK